MTKSKKKVAFKSAKVKLVKKIYENNNNIKEQWAWLCSSCDDNKSNNNKRICGECGKKKKAKNITRSRYSHKLGGRKLKLKEEVIDNDVVNDDDNLNSGSYIGTRGTALFEGSWRPCVITEVSTNNYYLCDFDEFKDNEEGSQHHVLKRNFKSQRHNEQDISEEEIRNYLKTLLWKKH